ncbi:MAG TPA: hydroxymethylbilane synthase [Parafilimonas sp.]|nr:hydroxymethylbilane synthase [Parafilimonas sp.]
MANTIIRIGTRESPLAVWQAQQVKNFLAANGIQSELIYIKSEGDTDLITPLYALGVQGIFTKALDAALLNNRIDMAVHSLKDVPVQMAEGIVQAAVLKRGSYKDIFVYKDEADLEKLGYINGEWTDVNRQTSNVNREPSLITHHSSLIAHHSPLTIATSSVRRIAQWLNRYPDTTIGNLRGNVNTRLRKLKESNWHGAIFAAAGLERIDLRPSTAVDLDWMLPAPAQGAIAVVCRKEDQQVFDACRHFNDEATALCVKIERDFLKALMGGCSTPISALAEVKDDEVVFRGNVLSVDGKERAAIEKTAHVGHAKELGITAGKEILSIGADKIIEQIRHAQ